MTVTVSFEAPQIQVSNSSDGIQLSQVILPYSIRNSEDSTKYLGGQMTLGQSDGIKLTDNTKDWERLGLAKIKAMVAGAEIYVPNQIVEAPVSSAEDSVVSSATEAPVSSGASLSSGADSVASSEATFASSVADSVASSVADSVASSSVEASASSAEAPASSEASASSAVE